MRRIRAGLGLAALLTLSGCLAVGPDYQAPGLTQDHPAFTTRSVAFQTDQAPPEDWWRGLKDPVLDQLVQRALGENFDIKIATANLLAVRALRDQSRASLFPAIDASAAYARARQSAATQLANPNITAPDVNLTQGALGLSWELDLFGRVRRSVEAAEADLAQSDATRRQVVIALIADIASNYIDLRGAQLRLAVADRNAQNQRDTFQLTMTLSDAGRGTDLDVARARAQLETTLASIPPLRSQIARDKHQLAVLAGMKPDGLDALLDPAAPLPVLPQFLPVGGPTDILRRRPDIAAAERGLAAATARIGVATANFYPTISFTAIPSLQALQPGDLGKKGAFAYSLGPSLTLPIFDLGVYAKLRGANASQQAAMANFQKTLLTALAETETALDAYQEEASRRQSLSIAARASGKAAELASTRYRFGAENFLTVLDAEAKQLAAEDQQAQSEIALALDLVTIYRALGGGWNMGPPVTAE